MFFPKLPEDAEHTTVLLVETSAPLRFPNSYSTSCELQGRRSVRYYPSLGYLALVGLRLSELTIWLGLLLEDSIWKRGAMGRF